MATDVYLPESVDLYYLLVENIFQSIFFSGVGMVIIFLLLGAIMRMSPLLMSFIIGLFVIAFGIGYGGSLFALLGFIGACFYFFSSVFRLLAKLGGP